jgi:hypothetical protein
LPAKMGLLHIAVLYTFSIYFSIDLSRTTICNKLILTYYSLDFMVFQPIRIADMSLLHVAVPYTFLDALDEIFYSNFYIENP